MNKLLLTLFVIGCTLGISAGVYINKTLITIRNYDYICGIETMGWTDCSDGMWSDPNFTSKEKILLSGDIIPAKSKIYKGRETKLSSLKYGNTKEGCNGTFLFSSLSNKILQIKDSKGKIRQEVDVAYGGMVFVENEGVVKFVPIEQRTCIKKESVESVKTKRRTPVRR